MITLQDLLFYRDSNIQVDTLVLDFSKAFDTVPHDSLLNKLHHYGIQDKLANWIRKFLQNREQQVLVDGTRSDAVSVDSGVPQGSVLGPLLFLLHVNDMPLHVSSKIRLFADDCLLYRAIKSTEDQIELQKDLDSLVKWGVTWGMKFNAKKCNLLRISRSRSPFSYFYSINEQFLDSVDHTKYLGVNIASDLDWSEHISAICNKGNATLGFIRRNLKECPRKLKETAYFTLVRSKLEYAAAVWDPYKIKDINQLEKVQRRAARFTCRDYRPTSSVTQMLKELGWSDLASRRRSLRLTLFYKVVHHLVAVPTENILVPADQRTRSNHKFKFRHLTGRTNAYSNSFFPRAIVEFNQLPEGTVDAPSTESFKDRLAKHFD